MLPKRREPTRSGIARAPRREWPRHRAFVRRHQCCVPGCEAGPIEFMHVRSAANAGTAVRPFDWFGVSGCTGHHREQHDHGAETFMKKYGIDLWKLAAEFAKASPDLKMKEAMRDA